MRLFTASPAARAANQSQPSINAFVSFASAAAASAAAAVLLLCPTAARAQVVFSATGVNAAAITPARDNFRTALGGGIVAGANGSFGGLRREINWDGVPDSFASPNNLPGNFFNVNSPRGVLFGTPGNGFQVSANAGIAPTDFGNIDPTYPTNFEAFSAQRLFTAISSNITDVSFVLPGTASPATVRGFGSIFSDVDLANTTSLQFFSATNVSLGVFPVLATSGNATFSFLGVDFGANVVGRVRITSGNSPLGAGILDQNGNPNDLVVMDDFIYSEPVAVSVAPEPGTLALCSLGLVSVAGFARRRK